MVDIGFTIYTLTILLAIPAFLITGIQLIRKFLVNKQSQTIFLALFFIIGAIAISFLVIEQAWMEQTYSDEPEDVELDHLVGENDAEIGRYLVCFAILLSAGCIITINYFVLYFLSPRYRLLIIPLAGLALLYALLYFVLDYSWIKTSWIWEYHHSPQDEAILLWLFLVPVWFSLFLLASATYLIRTKPRPFVLRSSILTVGQFIISVAYSIQIVEPSIISGLGFLCYPIIMYIAFTMPPWFQELIGWDQ